MLVPPFLRLRVEEVERHKAAHGMSNYCSFLAIILLNSSLYERFEGGKEADLHVRDKGCEFYLHSTLTLQYYAKM